MRHGIGAKLLLLLSLVSSLHGDGMAEMLAAVVTPYATPVGRGTAATAEGIQIHEAAGATVIAWMRHQTTAYDQMKIPRIKDKRRETCDCGPSSPGSCWKCTGPGGWWPRPIARCSGHCPRISDQAGNKTAVSSVHYIGPQSSRNFSANHFRPGGV